MPRPVPARLLLGFLPIGTGAAMCLRYLRRVITNQETIMQAIDALVAKVDAVKTDVERLLDALGQEHLSPETQAKVDQLAATLDGLDAAMDAAVPEPTTPGEPE